MEYRDENKLPNEISLINKIKADLHLRYLIIKYTGKYVKLWGKLVKNSNSIIYEQCKLTKLIVCGDFHYIITP